MFLIDRLAEERIQQSIKRGDLDNLPGTGERLQLEDDSFVPAEMRAAYRLLKNAGFVPPEVEWRRELSEVEALLLQTEDADEQNRIRRRLLLLRLRLEQCGNQLYLESTYRDRLFKKLTGEQVSNSTINPQNSDI